MKKKLEAELISIAHRILKMKNRAELVQLQQETLKLYEKLSVLKFVEDNFNEVKPTIGYASAQEKLEDIYEQETQQEPEAKENVATEKAQEEKQGDEAVEDKKEEAKPVEDNKQQEAETGDKDEVESKTTAPEREKEELENVAEPQEAEQEETTPKTETANESVAEPEQKIELEQPAEEIKEEEEAVKKVYEEEQDSAPVMEERAEDAAVKAVTAHKDAEVQQATTGFEFAFERKAAPEEPKERKEITFEDFHDYKEPEFVKKDADAPSPAEVKTADDNWQNWEPKKAEPQTAPQQSAPASAPVQRSLNDTLGKSINIGLNDRIAFEKHLFGGSGEDLNRVLSQLNTFDSFYGAQNFIEDLVKPDYNYWKNKEEYEERFMELVAKKFD